jgi:glycosyltransferase involved in cell wall biosynthesis
LSRQADALQIAYEIVVVDDASTDATIVQKNSQIATMPNCRFVLLDERIDIAKMRNRLLQEAKYQWILSLDADVFPADANFLKRYVDAMGQVRVVCGGLAYRSGNEQNVNSLRYKYGITHEVLTLKQREARPYLSFKTSNYLIDSKLAQQIRFDETFVDYGHEDTLFGEKLQLAGEPILHIQNPVYHDDTDTAEQFLAKTRRGIENLKAHSDELRDYSQLLQTYSKLQKLHLTGFVAFKFRLLRSLLERNLLSNKPSMRLFGFYKLGYLCTLK